MKVLVTGGFGSIGTHVVDALRGKGYQVAVFDKVAGAGVESHVGDLRDPKQVAPALQGVDAVIHLAGIIPPRSELDVAFSHAVNVTGTAVLVDVMKQTASCKRLIFASTATVHGAQKGRTGPLTADDALDPPNHYAKQKVEAEECIRASGLDYTILRVPAVPPIKTLKGKHKEGTLLLDMPPDGQIEILHPDDAGLAFANAVECREAIGRTMMLGGGKTNGCQLTGYEFATGITRAVGLGTLPRSVFGRGPDRAHASTWVDTTDSQRLLNYQQHSFGDLTKQLQRSLGATYYLAWVFSPLVRVALRVRSLAM